MHAAGGTSRSDNARGLHGAASSRCTKGTAGVRGSNVFQTSRDIVIPRKLREYVVFLRHCIGLLADDKRLFAGFVALSIFAALTEGFTISLLIPILEAQGQ